MSKSAYTLNGKPVTREEFLKGANDDFLKPRKAHVQACRSNKSMQSESTGVLPNQVDRVRSNLAALQEKGELTGVSIGDNGLAEFSSTGEQGRKGWMRYRKKVDFEGGYGDTYTDDGRYGD